MERLSDDAVDEAVRAMGWRREGDRLVKTVEGKDFADSMRVVNAVAELAEARNHHPDIAIHWNRVDLTLWTHTAGGITQADLDLARAVDELA